MVNSYNTNIRIVHKNSGIVIGISIIKINALITEYELN